MNDIDDVAFEEQVVSVWGYEDLKPAATKMLELLHAHRPGELTELKHQLWMFVHDNEVRSDES